MTFHSLMNWGGFAGSYGKTPHSPIERYHSGSGGGYHHHHHGGSKYKGGGSGAALSALTLLAFLFLMNVMQQSLQEDTNSTNTNTGGTTAVLLRDNTEPTISFLELEEKQSGKGDDTDGFIEPLPPVKVIPNGKKREKILPRT